MKPCTCPKSGFCQRYGVFMGPSRHALCQGKSNWPTEKASAYLERLEANAGQRPPPKTTTCEPTGYRGVGTVLKSFFEWFGLKDDGKCGCNNKVKQLDCRGVEWCQENYSTILSWLKKSAQERGIPFAESASKVALNWAIDTSRKERDLWLGRQKEATILGGE